MTVDARILAAIRQASQTGISGAELASRLGISRAAVWARIEELRQLGYCIEASPHGGYKLVGTPDVLHADDLLARLHDQVHLIGRDIRVFEETTSTNDIAEKLARDGVKEGVVVFAEAQREGRGRLGRTWLSPRGKGLWFSVLLRPPCRPQAVTQLTVAAAVATCRAIEKETQTTCTIKWPNDIRCGELKVAGILTELAAELDVVKHVVLGIGVNVNLTAADLPRELKQLATSLRIVTGRKILRPSLAVELLIQLDREYQKVLAGRFAEISDEWAERCDTLGQSVRIQVGSRILLGRAEALDSDGALLVRSQHGHLEAVTGGDVSILK